MAEEETTRSASEDAGEGEQTETFAKAKDDRARYVPPSQRAAETTREEEAERE